MQTTANKQQTTNNTPLITPRLRIVPLGYEHLTARYVGWLNDPVVVRYSEQRHRTHTLASCRAYWQSFHATPHGLWAIERADDPDAAHVHIGNISATVDTANGLADVGILLGERDAWGRGYGGEAWQAVLEHLLCDMGLRKITAGTLSVNAPMLRLMQRAGMIEDGRRRDHYLFEGRFVDVVYAALYRAQH